MRSDEAIPELQPESAVAQVGYDGIRPLQREGMDMPRRAETDISECGW